MSPSGARPLATVRTVAALREATEPWRRAGETIGLVPTMGALHAGHLALVKAAKASCDHVVTTLFVNPAQFGANEDLSRYPRREADDAAALDALGVDYLFAPSADEIYPAGFATAVSVGGVAERLEGVHRPGHFDGVTTVVCKLLTQAQPTRAYFGEKDYQQLQVVRKMTLDLDLPVEIVGVPTVREADGLALSSRNEYLSAEERAIAPVLNRTLTSVAAAVAAGTDPDQAAADGERGLLDAGFARVDYVAVADAVTLAPARPGDTGPRRVLAAAFLGKTRLIDNIALAD